MWYMRGTVERALRCALETLTWQNPFVMQNLATKKVSVLIDTGADISVMSESFFKKLEPKLIRQLNRHALAQCTSASGNDFKNVGKALVEFRMGQTTFQWTFQVLKGLTKQVILGSDFLGKNKALIDFREATLRVGKHVFQMEGRDKTAPECYLLKTLGRVELKPQASTLFPCKVSSQVPSGSYLVRMIDTAEGFCDQPGIAIANAVVQVTDSTQVNILAVNETGGRQVIPRHAVIATLESVPESEIDSITVVPDLDRVADAQPQAVDLDVENAQQLSDLIDRYPDVFANSDLNLGSTDLVECNINTGDTAPIKQRPYRTPFLQRSVVEDHLTKLLAANIIRPSVSPWASPIVIVGKKDKTTRMCIDFRKVNACSVPNCYPLPQIDDILASLGGAKYFSKMDLKSGYHQIPMSEESRPKTAFITHMGLFEYNRMPFGLAGAPPIFQDLMNNVLQGLLHDSVLAYLDDVIVYSKTIEDHLIHVEQVFLRFRKAGLKLKFVKMWIFHEATSIFRSCDFGTGNSAWFWQSKSDLWNASIVLCSRCACIHWDVWLLQTLHSKFCTYSCPIDCIDPKKCPFWLDWRVWESFCNAKKQTYRSSNFDTPRSWSPVPFIHGCKWLCSGCDFGSIRWKWRRKGCALFVTTAQSHSTKMGGNWERSLGIGGCS